MESLKSFVEHRPWAIPRHPWSYYQEWKDVVFLHYKVNEELLKTFIPKQLVLDKFKGESWLSIVGFNMEQIRPRLMPSVDSVSNFYELNIRTYVKSNGKPGVYFLSIEASKSMSCTLAKIISKLPYEFSNIKRENNWFKSENKNTNNFFFLRYKTGDEIKEKNELEHWLTERYALFQNYKKRIYAFEIHHKAWRLQSVKIQRLVVDYPLYNSMLSSPPNAMHYTKGVAVLSWKKTKEKYT